MMERAAPPQTKPFAVFLSFNSKDRAEVKQLAEYLDTVALRPWLDEWELIPGESWVDGLHRGLQASATCAVFVGSSGEGPWHETEIRNALIFRAKDPNFRMIPVLLPSAKHEPELPPFLPTFLWVDFRGKSLADDDACWRLECGIRGHAPGRGRPCASADDPPLPLPRIKSAPPPRRKLLPRLLILTLTVFGLGGGWWWQNAHWPILPPQPRPIATPQAKATATPIPMPTVAPTVMAAASCWEDETPGATCTEEVSGMAFVYVPGGEFWMGCGEQETGCDDDEKPRHHVRVKGFWMGQYEVTQAQWQAIMKDNPSNFKGADRPVETVSWNDAQAFLQKLNATVETHGRASLQFRLPSEAEWEYAARAGTQTAYSFGDDSNQLGEYAWYAGNSNSETHPVGQKEPNAFGLYDMHGNVWEWCADTYHDGYADAPTDGSVWGNLGGGKAKSLRGGSWGTDPGLVRSASRHGFDPDGRNLNHGFRVVVGVGRTL